MLFLDECKVLGKPIWTEVASKFPRAQNDGTLGMPSRGGSVDLKALRREFPQLPFVKPAPAAARADVLLRRADGARVGIMSNHGRMQQCEQRCRRSGLRGRMRSHCGGKTVSTWHEVCMMSMA